MMPCRELRRMALGTSIVMLISAPSLTVGCASARRGWSTVGQSTPHARGSQAVPGDWERVEALRPGTPLVVRLKSGGRITGAFKTLHPMTLALINRDGSESSVRRSDVATIVTRGARDGLTNGTLIGIGIGLTAAAVILSMIGSGDGYVLPSAEWGAPLLLSSIGGVVGALIDRAHEGEEILYVAPSTSRIVIDGGRPYSSGHMPMHSFGSTASQ
jgi:hypothetical protein